MSDHDSVPRTARQLVFPNAPAELNTTSEYSHKYQIRSDNAENPGVSHSATHGEYLHRTESKAEGTERNANNPATVLSGTQAEFDYDAIAELTFADSGAFQTFFSLVQQPENTARIAADEEKCLDRSKVPVVVLSETLVTTK